MFRLLSVLVLLFGSLISHPAIAQSSDDCVLPDLKPPSKEAGPDALRTYRLNLLTYQICTFDEDQQYIKHAFPGGKELYKSYRDRLIEERRLWRDRRSLPSLEELKRASAASKAELLEKFKKFTAFDFVSKNMTAGDGLIPQDFFLDPIKAEYSNPRAAAAQIAKTVRIDLPDPWFELGFIDVRSKVNPDAANKAFNLAKKLFDSANQSLKDDRTYYAKRINEIDRERSQLQSSYDKLLRQKEDLESTEKAVPAALKSKIDATFEKIAEQSDFREKVLGEYTQALDKKEQLVQKRQTDMMQKAGVLAQRVVSGAILIDEIKTSHASATPIDEEDRKNILAAMDAINADLRNKYAKRKVLKKQQDEARKAFLDAANEASNARILLGIGGALSVGYQTFIEIQASAFDLALAGATAGPQGMFVEAGRQIGTNIAFGVDFYSASGLGPKSYKTDNKAENKLNIDAEEALFQYVVKEISTLRARTLIESAGITHKKEIANGTRSFLSEYLKIGNPVPGSALNQLAQQEEAVEAAQKVFSKSMGKAGLKALGKSLTKQIGLSMAKELVKAGSKKGVAELIEGSALQNYITAQAALTYAFEKRRHHGKMFWKNEDEITASRALLDRYLNLRFRGGFAYAKNEAFFPTPGYRIELGFKPNLNINPSELKMNVYLGGVELKRDTGTTAHVFVVPEGTKYDLQSTEALALIIEIDE